MRTARRVVAIAWRYCQELARHGDEGTLREDRPNPLAPIVMGGNTAYACPLNAKLPLRIDVRPNAATGTLSCAARRAG